MRGASTRVARLAAALAAVAACAASAWLPAAAAAAPLVPREWMGVVASDPSLLAAPAATLDRELLVMRRAGVGTLRVPVYWPRIQPWERLEDVPADDRAQLRMLGGRPADLRALDRLFTAAARAGVRVLPTVLRAPAWAALNPFIAQSAPRDPQQFAQFVAGLANRYGADGTFWAEHGELTARPVTRWQLWNEPDLDGFWAEQPYVTGYVGLLRAVRPALRAADPGARLVLAGFPNDSWNRLAEIYAAGARGLFDEVAIHPYTASVVNALRVLRRARAVMRSNGDAGLGLLVTEMGYASGAPALRAPTGVTWNVTPAEQAQRLRALYRGLARARIALRIRGAFWYSWFTPERTRSDSWEDYTGLRRRAPGGQIVAKPALRAYAVAAARLAGP